MLYIDETGYTIVIIALNVNGIIENSDYDMLHKLPPGKFRSDMLVYILIMKFKSSTYNNMPYNLHNSFSYHPYLRYLKERWNELSKKC